MKKTIILIIIAILAYKVANSQLIYETPILAEIKGGEEKNFEFYLNDLNYKLIELRLRYSGNSEILLRVNGMEVFRGKPNMIAITPGIMAFDITDLVNLGRNSIWIKNLSPEIEKIRVNKIEIFGLKAKNNCANVDEIKAKLKAGDKVIATKDYLSVKKGQYGTYWGQHISNPHYACISWNGVKSGSFVDIVCPSVPNEFKSNVFILPFEYIRPLDCKNTDNIPPKIEGFTSALATTAQPFYTVNAYIKDNSQIYAAYINRIKASDATGKVKITIKLYKPTNEIKLVAYDKYGNKTQISKIVKINKKDTIPPQIVEITSPQNFQKVGNYKISIKGKAQDNIGVKFVQITVNTQTFQVPVDFQGSFNLQEAILNQGTNKIEIKAIDFAGNVSPPVNITVYYTPETTKPTITVINPKLFDNKIIISKDLQQLPIKVSVKSQQPIQQVAITKLNSDINIKLEKSNEPNVFKKTVNLPLDDTILVEIKAINIYGVSGTAKFWVIRETQDLTCCPDIDNDFPITGKKCSDCYALIIGNFNYNKTPKFSNLPYVQNDAQVVKKYFINTLGIPQNNIEYHTNLNTMDLIQTLSFFIAQIKQNPNAKYILYYAGHGDIDNNTPYIVPTDYKPDMDIYNIRKAFILDSIFYKLTYHNPTRVVVILDMCYSGLKTRGAIYPKDHYYQLDGNIIVLSASKKDAYPFEERNHGLFTYAFLKALYDYKGDLTYKQLFDEIQNNINTIILKRKLPIKQEPAIFISPIIEDQWQGWKFP